MRRRGFGIIGLVCLGLCFWAGPVAPVRADTPAHVREQQDKALAQTYERLVKDPSYQKEFLEPKVPKPPSGFARWLASVFRALGPVFRGLFWVGIVVVVGAFLFYLVRELIRLRWNRKPRETGDGNIGPQILQPDADRAQALLADADRLAAQGRFAEAVHLLLFRSIADLEAHLPGSVRSSQTSREIALIAAMPAEPRSGFERIRDLVETSFFGGRELGAAQFTSARMAYETFAFSSQWPQKQGAA